MRRGGLSSPKLQESRNAPLVSLPVDSAKDKSRGCSGFWAFTMLVILTLVAGTFYLLAAQTSNHQSAEALRPSVQSQTPSLYSSTARASSASLNEHNLRHSEPQTVAMTTSLPAQPQTLNQLPHPSPPAPPPVSPPAPPLSPPGSVKKEEAATNAAASSEGVIVLAPTGGGASRQDPITKRIVPLATPQGYDPDAGTLTLGRWQVSGVARDPTADSPALAMSASGAAAAPGLLHRARPPQPHAGAVMGLAAYPNDIMGKFERFVGTLRFTGFGGHVILGVHPNLSQREAAYLQAMNVTYYASEAGPCTTPFRGTAAADGSEGGSGSGSGGGTNYIRGTCSKHYPRLVFEWARYEMALGWIKGCSDCQGWMLVCDVKDTVFQRPPFEDLPPSHKGLDDRRPDLLLFEEAYPPPMGFDNNHWFAWGSIKNCFGKEHEREIMADYRNKPVLCSGSTIGTRAGLSRYLAAITRRFYEMSWLGPSCTPPEAVDQPVHNWLFYTNHGYRDEVDLAHWSLRGLSHPLGMGHHIHRHLPFKARAMRFGSGPVQTVGRLCAMAEKEREALVKRGEWANREGRGDTEETQLLQARWNLSLANVSDLSYRFFLNRNGKPAPVVHQYDRCWKIWAEVAREYCRRAHKALRTGPGGDSVRPDNQVCRGG